MEENEREIREERIIEERVVEEPRPVTRRTITETRTGGIGPRGGQMNPIAIGIAVLMAIFLVVLIFGYLL